MRSNRRLFLKYTTAGLGGILGAGTLWVSTSNRRSARWLRRMVSDARRDILPAPAKPAPSGWSDNAITLAWLGHATVLINFYGLKILTDPALADRVGISLGLGTAGPKRYIAPALTARELPSIDLILLSHAHMDHMDLPTLRKVCRGGTVITATSTCDVLSRAVRAADLRELAWGDRVRLSRASGDVEIEAFEVKHWGQRWPSEIERGYNGYIIRRGGRALLFGGDTAYMARFVELRGRGPFEAAIMPIGAYRPWIWNHCTPEEAFEMVNLARARYVIPIHHQTWKLSEEHMDEPIGRLEQAMRHEIGRLALKQIGETWVCPAV